MKELTLIVILTGKRFNKDTELKISVTIFRLVGLFKLVNRAIIITLLTVPFLTGRQLNNMRINLRKNEHASKQNHIHAVYCQFFLCQMPAASQ